jgi:dienelactone hydrolase
VSKLISLIAVFALLGLGPACAQEKIEFTARDGVNVFADFYATPRRDAPFILCFHMAKSNRGEYEKIAPRLVKLGFQVLAVDQRSGGGNFGRMNETVARLGKRTSYIEALPDLEAAIAWAKQRAPASKLLVWGSSYSASLVILLAAEHPEVDGVLSFSPGEYLGGQSKVAAAAAQVKQPIFMTSARDEAQTVAPIFAAAASSDKTQFIPKGHGEHGSSALLQQEPAPDEYWAAVETFLAKFK